MDLTQVALISQLFTLKTCMECEYVDAKKSKRKIKQHCCFLYKVDKNFIQRKYLFTNPTSIYQIFL